MDECMMKSSGGFSCLMSVSRLALCSRSILRRVLPFIVRTVVNALNDEHIQPLQFESHGTKTGFNLCVSTWET
jgi:hypothetical protein